MKLWQLPSSLFLLLLSLSYARPATKFETHGDPLTPDTFESTISEGPWLVEHFSPYCGHCKAFAPVWNELASLAEKGDIPVHMAQVDCSVNGDLCDKHNVKGYPQMNLYQDGKFVETYRGRRDRELLIEYLNKVAPPPPPPAPSAPLPNPDGTLLVLDASSFPLRKESGEPMFVKFYAPWCGHCKKLAPTWVQLAKHMQGKLVVAEVNCDEAKRLCTGEGVEGFPSLMYYSGGTKTEYHGGRKLDPLRAFAEKASRVATEEIRPEDLDGWVAENPVVYALVFPSNSPPDLRSQLAPLLGTPPVVTIPIPPETLSEPKSLYSRFKIPATAPWAIVGLKGGDAQAPTSVYIPPAGDLKEWLFANRLPISLELTQETFQGVMNAPHKPLVVILPKSSQAERRVGELAKGWKERGGKGRGNGREVVFTYMDGERWGDWMKSMYGVKKGEEGKVVVADHSTLTYYDTDVHGTQLTLDLTNSALLGAVEAILRGEVKRRNSENFVERIARSLNNWMTTAEKTIVKHPVYTVGAFVGVFVGAIMLIRKFVGDDVGDLEREKGRLD